MEFHFLKVNYESMVNWQQHTDYLCCSPQFFGTPHFDCVFICMTPMDVIFGWLLFLYALPETNYITERKTGAGPTAQPVMGQITNSGDDQVGPRPLMQ
jgi:hypothetical protein